MRTYDKLIATIFASQGTAFLRLFPGVPVAAMAKHTHRLRATAQDIQPA